MTKKKKTHLQQLNLVFDLVGDFLQVLDTLLVDQLQGKLLAGDNMVGELHLGEAPLPNLLNYNIGANPLVAPVANSVLFAHEIKSSTKALKSEHQNKKREGKEKREHSNPVPVVQVADATPDRRVLLGVVLLDSKPPDPGAEALPLEIRSANMTSAVALCQHRARGLLARCRGIPGGPRRRRGSTRGHCHRSGP